eukprot:TRINITY_DN12662_c0_g1_i2.p1 TRINITY_DN12662_c0_g1~~TRINITY_DN12662_c0_g1_i2.p1  ORF type:complete len:1799 (-),score=363.00 TRINITY_DN12662_c0_g1_i2:149-5545(-)
MPTLKSIEVYSTGVKGWGANDGFKLKPQCLQSAITAWGNWVTSPSNGDWSGASTCAAGYKAVSVGKLDAGGSYDGDTKNFAGIFCDGNGCKVRSWTSAVGISAMCVKDVYFQKGVSQQTSAEDQWTAWSDCPVGMLAAGVSEVELLDDKKGSSIRIVECKDRSCRAWGDGGRIRVRSACISQTVRAKAICSEAHQDLQVLSTGGGLNGQNGVQTTSACPANTQLLYCSCYSQDGVCNNDGSWKPPGNTCSFDFASNRGEVFAYCARAAAHLITELVGQQSIFDAQVPEVSWQSKTVTWTHPAVSGPGSGTRALKFRTSSGKDVKIFIRNVQLMDGATGTGTQSIFADADNTCMNTRWQIELPALETGSPYEVIITYGDSRAAVQTSSCEIGTSGRMDSAAHPQGLLAKNKFKSVKKTVFVHAPTGQTKGTLIFKGEAVSSCSGIHQITVNQHDHVAWVSCGTSYQHAWELVPSKSQPGNLALRYRSRGEEAACVNPENGDLENCASQEDIAHHMKQVFSLDYLPPLTARWTMFASGMHEQQGACINAVGRHLRDLAANQYLMDCGEHNVLSSYSFRMDAACSSSNYYRFYFTCHKGVTIGPSATCVFLETPCQALASDAKLWHLEMHDVGSGCPIGTMLNRVKFEQCSMAGQYQYKYTCCPVQGTGGCQEKETEWGEVGSNSDLASLQYHTVSCDRDAGLRRFLLEAKVPQVAQGETLEGEVRYIYECCRLPLAPPVQVDTGPLQVGSAASWEGLFCPAGRSEGIPNYKGPVVDIVETDSANHSLHFDRLHGRWCLDTLCSERVAARSPVELDLEESRIVEYTPLMAFDSQYTGMGVVEVGREGMDLSLLREGGTEKHTGMTSLKNAKFKKLPRIKPARFEAAEFKQAEYSEYNREAPALDSLAITDEILNWAPASVQYSAHCLARESVEQIAQLDSVNKSQSVTGACYNAMNSETWGVDGNLWSHTVDPSKAQVGLTSDVVYACSSRDIERGKLIESKYRDYAIAQSAVNDLTLPTLNAVCTALPAYSTNFGTMVFNTGVEYQFNDVCKQVMENVFGVVNFGMTMGQEEWHKKFYTSDYDDCNPIQNGFSKAYCDLSCVEEAVKHGDEHILSSMSQLNKNIVSQMKTFFDHYVEAIFKRMTHMEAKADHENSQIRKMMDTYAEDEIDAINSNGKQLTKFMNSQHSQLNKNLGNAAKQLFDLIHGEHQVIAGNQRAALQATSEQLAALGPSFDEALENFAEQHFTKEDGKETLIQAQELLKLRRRTAVALRTMQGKTDLAQFEDVKVAQQILQDLELRTRLARPRQGGNVSTADMLQEARNLHDAANWTAEQLIAASHGDRSSAPRANEVENVKQETLKVMQATRASAAAHVKAVGRLRRGVVALKREEVRPKAFSAETAVRWQETRTSSSFMGDTQEQLLWELRREREEQRQGRESQQLVELDKAMMRLRQATERYLEAAQEQPKHVHRAASLVEGYVSSCSANYEEMQLAVRRALAAGAKAAKASRVAVQEVAQELGLLADILVDGQLLRLAIGGAAQRLGSAARNGSAALLDMGVAAQGGVKALLGAGLWHAIHKDFGAELRELLPASLLGKVASAQLLAEELAVRSNFHGLARAVSHDLELMQQSWKRVAGELDLAAESAYDAQGLLGFSFAQRLDAALATWAAAPLGCTTHLNESQRGRWFLWDGVGTNSRILLRSPARLLQHAWQLRGKQPSFDASQELPEEFLVCSSHATSNFNTRNIERGELVLCLGSQRFPGQLQGQRCQTGLPSDASAVATLLNAMSLPLASQTETMD